MKYYQKLLNKLLDLFKRKRPDKTDKLEQTNVITYSEEQLDLFNLLEPGDLVFADMPIKKSERNKILEGHRSRPYLVLRKGKDYVHAYYCSSVSDRREQRYDYKLLQSKYDFHKHGDDGSIIETDCHVYFQDLVKLDIVHLKFLMTKIDRFDLQQINKIIMLKSGKESRLFEVENIPFIGEIYSYKKHKYYVYGIKDKTLECYSLHEADKSGSKTIMVNRKPYSVNFGEKKEIDFAKSRLISISDPSINLKIEKMIANASKSSKFERKIEKRKKHNSYICHYTIGGLYQEFRTGNKVVYLYSQNGTHYGFDYRMSMDLDYIRIIKINPDRNKPMIRKIDDEYMCDLICELTSQNHKLYDYFDANYRFDEALTDDNIESNQSSQNSNGIDIQT